MKSLHLPHLHAPQIHAIHLPRMGHPHTFEMNNGLLAIAVVLLLAAALAVWPTPL